MLRNHFLGPVPTIPPVPSYTKTPKIGPRYPRVDNLLAEGTRVFHLDITHLYHPSHPRSSTLLSCQHLDSMLSKFARPLGIGGAHK